MFTSKVGQPEDLLISQERIWRDPPKKGKDKKKKSQNSNTDPLKSLLLTHSLNLLKHRAENTKIQFLY